MTEILNGKPTMSFWFIGGVALIWNLFGLSVYVMQVSATPAELASAYSADQVAFIDGTPAWAVAAFALAVTTGVLACLLLLLRKAWALPMFVISLASVLIQNVNSYVLNDAIELFGPTPAIIQVVVVLIGVGLIAYARMTKARGWLR